MISNFKHERIRDKKHCVFVKTLPCAGCPEIPPSDYSHVGDKTKGMATKVGDNKTIPLCRKCHNELHQNGEERYYNKIGGRDMVDELGRGIFEHTGNKLECLKLIVRFRNE
jgi:hypothetical protein